MRRKGAAPGGIKRALQIGLNGKRPGEFMC